MSNFQIHHDSNVALEKENPQRLMRSKKPGLTAQPLATIGGYGMGNVIPSKDNVKQPPPPQKRVVLGEKLPALRACTGASKVPLQKQQFGKQKQQNAVVAKSAVVAPPATRNIGFKIYEDEENVQEKQTAAVAAQSHNNNDVDVVVGCGFSNKELFDDFVKQHGTANNNSSDSPMSVICASSGSSGGSTIKAGGDDALSPMSIDQSLVTVKSGDVSIDEEQEEQQQEQQQPVVVVDDRSVSIAPWAVGPSRALQSLLVRERFFDVLEYQDDILNYLYEVEKKNRPKPNYMQRQIDITDNMRIILADWLVEVSQEYNISSEGVYLAMGYVDRFLSTMSVVRAKLQLVGVTCMFIAAKYEEVYPPSVTDFAYITDDTYSKAQILRMEQIVLRVLAFDMSIATPITFLNLIACKCNMQDQLLLLATYIAELSILETRPYVNYLPSQIAAGAIVLARITLMMDIWSVQLEDVIKYSLRELKPVVLALSNSHNIALTSQQQAIPEKFKKNKFGQVSLIEPVDLDSELYDELEFAYNADLRHGLLQQSSFAHSPQGLEKLIKSSDLLHH